MADQHDKSKKPDAKGKRQPGKPFDIDLEIPEHQRPDEPEVVEEVIEVVEEDVPMVQAAEEVQPVEEVLDVVELAADTGKHKPAKPTTGISKEEAAAAKLEETQLPPTEDEAADILAAEEPFEVVDLATDTGKHKPPDPTTGISREEAAAAKEAEEAEAKRTHLGKKEAAKTHVAGKGGVPTMIAPEGGEAEEILEATEASSPSVKPGAKAAEKTPRKDKDTDSAIDLGGEGAEEAFDVVETVPSSATVAAALVEGDEETAPKKPGQKGKGGAEPMEVVVDYEEVLVEGESEIDIGQKTGKPDRPSGVDIIAEALESGVDLDRGKTRTPPQAKKREQDSDVAYEDVLEDSAESSAVDLGSSGQARAFQESPPPMEGPKRPLAEEVGEAEASDVLGAEALIDETKAAEEEEILVRPRKKTMAAMPSELEEEVAEAVEEPVLEDVGANAAPRRQKDVVEEMPEKEVAKPPRKPVATTEEEVIEDIEEDLAVEPRGEKAAVMEEEAVPVETKATPRRPAYAEEEGRPAKKRSSVVPFLLGGFVAALLVVGGLGAVWFLAPDLLPESPNASKKPGTGGQLQPKEDRAALEESLAKTQDQVKKLEADAKDAKELEDKLGKQIVAADAAKTAAETTAMQAQATAKATEAKLKDAETKFKGVETLLAENKLPTQPDKLKPVVENLVKAWNVTEQTANVLKKAKLITDDKMLDAAAMAKAVDDLRKAYVDTAAAYGNVTEALAKAGVKDPKEVAALVTARDTLTKERDTLAKERTELNDLIESALVELGLGKKADKKQLVTSIKDAVSRTDKELRAELALARQQLANTESPEQRLDVMLALLGERSFKDAKELERFTKFAGAVRSDAKASPEVKAKALYAEALIQRNQENFAQARKTLDLAIKEAAALKDGKALQTAADQSLKEMSDPAAYYLPRVDRQVADAQLKGAFDELNAGLKALPGEPRLLLKRAQIEFQAAAAKGKIDEATQKRIREDAEAARKDEKLAAESFFLVGQLEEHNGDFAKAEDQYRQAVKLGGAGAEGERYRIALARILQRDRSTGASPLQDEPQEEEVKLTDEETDADLFWCAAAQLPGEGDDVMAAKRLQESIDLANQLIQSANPKTRGEGYLLLGTAQARQGKKTEGLKNFVKGLELVYPGMATQDLTKILESHPAFSQPDVVLQQNPLVAERHFGKGLDFFWSKKYVAAEEEFKKAVSFFDEDARYRYFLGMARYLQNTKEKRTLADFDFEQGFRLEVARKPATRDINASLERIQGDLRRVLNGYREKLAAGG